MLQVGGKDAHLIPQKTIY